MTQKTLRLLIILSAVVVSASVAVLYFSPRYGYSRIEVTSAQYGCGTYEYGKSSNGLDIRYVFNYYSNQSFYVFEDWPNRAFPVGGFPINPSQIFPISQGATYKYSEIEIIVSQVHSSYFVLLVRNIS